MKEIIFDSHTDLCNNNQLVIKQNSFLGRHNFCDMNPDRFVLFIANKFVLVTYFSCQDCGSHLDFKQGLLKHLLEHNKIYERYEVNRGVDVRDDLRNFRIRNKELRKYVQQVNYLYSDNAGKEYAITTKISYLDAICGIEKLEERYIEALGFLKQKEYDWLLDDVKELYYANTLNGSYGVDTEVHNTIDTLVKSINQLTK